MDKNLDIFEYITNLDIGGGNSNQINRSKTVRVPEEEKKQSASFDFDNFAAGGDGNPNQVEKNKQ